MLLLFRKIVGTALWMGVGQGHVSVRSEQNLKYTCHSHQLLSRNFQQHWPLCTKICFTKASSLLFVSRDKLIKGDQLTFGFVHSSSLVAPCCMSLCDPLPAGEKERAQTLDRVPGRTGLGPGQQRPMIGQSGGGGYYLMGHTTSSRL